jgi:glycosyltransferase involved in cell wall biosynthesis
MHITLVHHQVGGAAGGGGGVRVMLELGLGLKQRGHRVTIACHDYLPRSEFAYATDQLEIRSVRQGVSETLPGNAALARRFWLQMPRVARIVPRDADVVNAHEWLALRPGRIAAHRLGIPLVWTRNDETPWERTVVPEETIAADPRLTRRILRIPLTWPDLLDARRACAIVVLSEGQVGMVRRSYRRDARVVPVGPPMHFFDPPSRDAARQRLGIPDDVFLVLASGILVEHRRFETLVAAMELLSDDPSVHALITGSDHVDPAYGDRLSALIADRDLEARVALPRRSVSDRELKDAYAAADAFVILSQRYAWGLAPLEAIASGTPVILTPGAGVYDILAGRPGIQVVPADDPDATATAIRRWRSGDGRRSITPTRQWLRAELSMDRYVERMEAIYTSVRGSAVQTSSEEVASSAGEP